MDRQRRGEDIGRRIRVMGLCLIAFGLAAVSATGAQASTEIVQRCFKTAKVGKFYTGHYLDKQCTRKASEEEISLGGTENKYELGFGQTWSAKGEKIKLLTAHGPEIKCIKSAGSGMVLGPTRVQATFVFAKCEGFGSRCTTPERKAGEIETQRLLGVIGENASKEVFVSFTGEEAGSIEPAPAETFGEFECVEGGGKFALRGTLSGKWTEAVNKLTKTGGIHFAPGTGEQGLVEQFPNSMSGEPEEEAATLEATQSFKFKAVYEMRQQ